MKLDKWAENDFATKCSAGDAVPTRPGEDIYGWDFHVEFAERPHIGSEESRPPIQTAYVQIKSSRGGALKAQIKLSNMLRACKSETPWFIIFIAADSRGLNQRYFGIHVWGDLIVRAMKEIRRAHFEKKKLHDRKITINFLGFKEITDDLIGWMRECIDSVGPNYRAKKDDFLNSIGYEGGAGRGTITLESENVEEMASGLLGLGQGLKASNFSFTPERFGIPDSQSQTSSEVGLARITPTPTEKCKFIFSTSNAEDTVKLNGIVYLNPIPTLGPWVRFSSPPFEVLSLGKRKVFRLDFNPAERLDLQQLFKLLKVLNWGKSADVDLKIEAPRGRLHGKIDFKYGNNGFNFKLANDVISLLVSASKNSSELKIEISLDEIENQLDSLILAVNVIAPFPIEFICEDGPDLPSHGGNLLYYVMVRIARWTFVYVVSRSIKSNELILAGRRFEADEPKVLDAWVSDEDDNRFLTLEIEAVYTSICQRLESTGTILGLGDISNYVKQSSVDR